MNYWSKSKFFKDDKIKYAGKSTKEIVDLMDKIRQTVDKPIIIHRAYDPKAKVTSQHFKIPCCAVDFHIQTLGITEYDKYEYLYKCFCDFFKDYPEITGLGVYPYWNNPGFHIDLREKKVNNPWLRNSENIYIPITPRSLRSYLYKITHFNI